MKRQYLIATIPAALLSSTAVAADLPVYDPPPAAYADSGFDWSGFYVGVHAGGAWGRQRDNQSELFPSNPSEDNSLEEDPTTTTTTGDGDPLAVSAAGAFNLDGFIGGVHVGHNWQSGSVVYGIEGDFDFTRIKGSTDYGTAGHLSLKSDWQGSVRARLGYAHDTWLFYTTGGVAFGHAKLTAANEEMSVSDSNTHVGWTVGAGIEKAFTPAVIGRLEVRYTDFGKKTYDLGAFGSSIRSDWNQTAVTVGLSYRF